MESKNIMDDLPMEEEEEKMREDLKTVEKAWKAQEHEEHWSWIKARTAAALRDQHKHTVTEAYLKMVARTKERYQHNNFHLPDEELDLLDIPGNPPPIITKSDQTATTTGNYKVKLIFRVVFLISTLILCYQFCYR